MADIVKLISTINMVKKKVDKGWFNRSHGRKGFCDCYKYEEMFNSKLEISYDRPKKMVYDLGIA